MRAPAKIGLLDVAQIESRPTCGLLSGFASSVISTVVRDIEGDGGMLHSHLVAGDLWYPATPMVKGIAQSMHLKDGCRRQKMVSLQTKIIWNSRILT